MNDPIKPLIKSNNNSLILNESICFYLQDGVDIKIPIIRGKKVEYISIAFKFSKSLHGSSIKNVEFLDDSVNVDMSYDCSPVGSGTVKPLSFDIGKNQYQRLPKKHLIGKKTHLKAKVNKL